jgi:hypothetical protein
MEEREFDEQQKDREFIRQYIKKINPKQPKQQNFNRVSKPTRKSSNMDP